MKETVYQKALALMDETDNADIYMDRADAIYPLLEDEVMELLDTDGCCESQDKILGAALNVLPYGLGAHLLADENPALASFLQQRYEELLGRYTRRTDSAVYPICDVYGGIGFSGGARW